MKFLKNDFSESAVRSTYDMCKEKREKKICYKIVYTLCV